MTRSLILSGAALLLVTGLALADPELRVAYRDGVPRVQILGDYAHTFYSVRRARDPEGPFSLVTDERVLCLGECYADDPGAAPGITYWYRFDLDLPDGRAASYGPYPVTISTEFVRHVGLDVFPNPGSGATRVRMFLHGAAEVAPVPARADLFDLGGRRIRTLHQGELTRAVTSLVWDGRGDDGRPLRAGVYFLRLSTPRGAAVARVARVE